MITGAVLVFFGGGLLKEATVMDAPA